MLNLIFWNLQAGVDASKKGQPDWVKIQRLKTSKETFPGTYYFDGA